ncbi:MAG TPA: hypothetical protein VFV73_16690 [Streptosporangiaceae bacterium]|nr:hypothetical protein [Streptosporangiaceae bacterium]
MNTLESRLRAELRAESELIGPEAIPALSLPERNGRQAARPPVLVRRRRPGWLTPLAAAAAVLAVVAGALTVSRVTAGGPAPRPATETPYSRLPPYYAVTVSGNVVSYTSGGTQYVSEVLGRSVQIRVTATGGIAATVRPPEPYNDFVVMSATADGRTFVLGAERYWGFLGAKSPLTGALDQAAPLRFVVLHVTPDGGVRQSALSLPFAVRPGQQPSIALSPDGTRLAVAYGGGGQAAIVRVITLATGQVREWRWPQAPWTPLIQGQGSWTASGRTLAIQQWYVARGAAVKPPASDAPAGTTLVRLVDTTAPPDAAAPGKLLALRAPAGLSAPWGAFITPDGSALVATTGTEALGAVSGRSSTSTGVFAVYSARTGALVRTLARWTWNKSQSPAESRPPAPAVAWSDPSGNRLLVIQPRDGVNRLGVLTGGRVVLTGNGLLPRRPEAYARLQAALPGFAGVPPHMTW